MIKTKKTAKNIDTARHLELENQLKRALADYQNLERRVEEEKRLLSNLSSAIEHPYLDNPLSRAYSLNSLLYQELLKGEHSVTRAFFHKVYKRVAVFYRIPEKFLLLKMYKKIPEDSASHHHQSAYGNN